MNSRKLRAFHGSARIKESFLKETHDWLEEQSIPLDPHEIAHRMLSGIRTFNPAEAVTLENYEAYPSKLGLPKWLANVVGTLYHENSHEDFSTETGFEQSFYIPFLSACNIGADYAPMFHQWEVFLLTKFLPQDQQANPLIHRVIDLHQQALSGFDAPKGAWVQANEELESALNDADENRKPAGQLRWHSMRAAYLSTLGFIEAEDEGVSSTESIAEVQWHDALLTRSDVTPSKKAMQEAAWLDIMNALLKMLKEWK
jgi:hypothetical protein